MPKCPNCSHDLPVDTRRMGSAILDELMATIGGPKELAKGLAEHFKKNKKDPKRAGALYRLLMEMIQEEDKANVHQNHTDEVAESQERAFVMEYELREAPLLHEIIAVARIRGMLPPEPQRIEAEYERVT